MDFTKRIASEQEDAIRKLDAATAIHDAAYLAFLLNPDNEDCRQALDEATRGLREVVAQAHEWIVS